MELLSDQERQTYVAGELLASGMKSRQVVNELMRMGVPQSTAYLRIETVRAEWQALAETSRVIRKAEMRARWEEVYRQAMVEHRFGDAAAALRGLADLDGLDEPQQHEHGAMAASRPSDNADAMARLLGKTVAEVRVMMQSAALASEGG